MIILKRFDLPPDTVLVQDRLGKRGILQLRVLPQNFLLLLDQLVPPQHIHPPPRHLQMKTCKSKQNSLIRFTYKGSPWIWETPVQEEKEPHDDQNKRRQLAIVDSLNVHSAQPSPQHQAASDNCHYLLPTSPYAKPAPPPAMLANQGRKWLDWSSR